MLSLAVTFYDNRDPCPQCTIQCNSMLYKTTISSAVAPSASAAGSVVRDLGVTVDYIRYNFYRHKIHWVPLTTSRLLRANIFTVRKKSFGQGNVFRSVCHSIHWRGGLCMMSLSIWLSGPMFLLGGLCPGGSLFWERGSLSRGDPHQNQKSRRYASYLNAFLFSERYTSD